MPQGLTGGVIVVTQVPRLSLVYSRTRIRAFTFGSLIGQLDHFTGIRFPWSSAIGFYPFVPLLVESRFLMFRKQSIRTIQHTCRDLPALHGMISWADLASRRIMSIAHGESPQILAKSLKHIINEWTPIPSCHGR